MKRVKRLMAAGMTIRAILLGFAMLGAGLSVVGDNTRPRKEPVSTRKSGDAGKKSSKQTARISSRRSRSKATRQRAASAKTGTKAARSTKSRNSRASRQLARQRARARALARLRILRSREEALQNAAASNIRGDLAAGEDLEIRRVAIDSLQGRAGTVVVMDPGNGRVYTIVNQRMALGSPVKPCSTIKMVVGLAALHDGVFDPNQDVRFSRRGSMTLTDAMARSNNPVFQVLGRQLGFDRVLHYAENYGFGQKTGVNYPGESPGFLPEKDEQETGLMSSHGENFGVTAIQLASFTAAIANGGSLYVPRTPRTPEEATNFEAVLNRKIDMSPEDRLRLMGGMIGAVNYGTGRLAYNPLGQVAGKTGTCTDRDKLGLFTSFSSVDNPRLVVTVITMGYQEAGKRAAEVAGRIYGALSPRFFQNRTITPAGTALELNN